jgi:phage-related minor tail protein
LSDTNNQTIRYSVDASGVEAGVSKLTSSATRVNQAMSQMADRAALVDRAMKEAADNGMSLSARQANALSAQVERLGRSMGAMGTRADQMRAKLASMGAANTFGPMIDDFEQVQKAAQGAHGGMAVISRELMVMGHEALTGNFKRLGGSAMVLGERLNVLQYVLSPLGAGLLATAAGAAAFAAVAFNGDKEAKQFAAALQMTGNYAGLTADSFAKMAGTVSSASGSGLGSASELLRSLAASGQYTSEQMQSLATVMLDTSRVTGQSLEDVSKLYEGLAKDPAKWAADHIDSMHEMNVSTLEQVEAMQRAGDEYAAFQTVVDALTQQVEDSSRDHLSAAAKFWDGLTSAIDGTWQAMKRTASGHETITDQINDLKAQRANVAASPEALQSIDSEVAALERQRRQLLQNADQLSAYQQVQGQAAQAESAVEKMRHQFATNAEKRAKDLEALRKDKASIEAAGGTMPDYDKLVAGINEKYKDRTPRGPSPVSGINADASSALQLRKLAEQQAQQQLQSQRQLGLISATEYYRQLHDIEAKALQDEIDVEQKRVDALSKSQGSAAYKEAAGKLALLKGQMSGLDATRDDSIAESQRQDKLSAMQFQFGLNNEVRSQQAGFSHSEDTQFMSAQMRQEYDQRYQIIEQFERKVNQLKDQYPGEDFPEYVLRHPDYQALV